MSNMTAQKRCDLINRTAQWCFDQTESWEHKNIGTGLAYLFWAISSTDGSPFLCGREEAGETYEELVALIKSNPNGLWQTLTASGFVIE